MSNSIMVIMFSLQWLRLGVNLSNMPLSVSALGFHVGLGGEWSFIALNSGHGC